jgi:Na+-translocating ferredoxin:NAD+ oxidoreductase RnfD subunit
MYKDFSRKHTALLIASFIFPILYFVSQTLYIWLEDLRWEMTASMLLTPTILSLIPMIYAFGEKLGYYDAPED